MFTHGQESLGYLTGRINGVVMIVLKMCEKSNRNSRGKQ